MPEQGAESENARDVRLWCEQLVTAASLELVVRTSENDEQIEILDAFPTRDMALVDRYRKGEREFGSEEESEAPSASRVVH